MNWIKVFVYIIRFIPTIIEIIKFLCSLGDDKPDPKLVKQAIKAKRVYNEPKPLNYLIEDIRSKL